MNLIELYQETPVEKHGDIKVVKDRVYIVDEDGDASLEYYIVDDNELLPVYSDRKLKADVKAIKNKVGA